MSELQGRRTWKTGIWYRWTKKYMLIPAIGPSSHRARARPRHACATRTVRSLHDTLAGGRVHSHVGTRVSVCLHAPGSAGIRAEDAGSWEGRKTGDATILTVRWPSLIFALSRCKYGLGASTSEMSRRLWRSWSMVIHPRARSEMAETTADKQYATHTCRAAGRTVETHSGISDETALWAVKYVHGSTLGSHRHAPA